MTPTLVFIVGMCVALVFLVLFAIACRALDMLDGRD